MQDRERIEPMPAKQRQRSEAMERMGTVMAVVVTLCMCALVAAGTVWLIGRMLVAGW